MSSNIKSPTNTTDPPPLDGYLRLPAVLKLIPVSRSTFYSLQSKGLVPKPVSLGPRTRAYRISSIKAFLADPENWQGGDDE